MALSIDNHEDNSDDGNEFVNTGGKKQPYMRWWKCVISQGLALNHAAFINERELMVAFII